MYILKVLKHYLHLQLNCLQITVLQGEMGYYFLKSFIIHEPVNDKSKLQ